MNAFSISQLEQFSGIKAHTIRIWEQRYNALSPERSAGNTRSYDSDQLRRLLNISSLIQDGLKPSVLCRMSDQKLFRLLEERLSKSDAPDAQYEYYIAQLIIAATGYDELYFDKLFGNCVLRLGLRNTYVKVIYPLLRRIGLLWTSGKFSPAYEHFCTQLIKQKISAAIDALPPPPAASKCWLLFLPEDEFHDIGLLFSYYLLKLAGKKVIYLGANVPLPTLKQAATETHPTDVLLFMVHSDHPEVLNTYLKALKGVFRKPVIHVAGGRSLLSRLKPGSKIHFLSSVEEFEKQLA